MARIDSIDHLRIYDSHLGPTTEYTVTLDGGACGRGASPHGETIGIYERGGACVDAEAVVGALRVDGILDSKVDQESFDAYLSDRVATFGKNTCYALSLALFEATQVESCGCDDVRPGTLAPPRLCLNILNGGRHAYTNAVLSNFSEYMLVARTSDVEAALAAHAEVQRVVHDALLACPKAVVNGNPVSSFATADDRECIEFLLGVSERLGLTGEFDLMIDAAASGLKEPAGYRLSVTDGSVRSSDEFCDYWLRMTRDYPLRFLEDPFGEEDGDVWTRLTTSQETCLVIGDDLYASDATRIEAGAAARRTHGVIIKPNQAGSITAVRRAVDAAKRTGQTAISSHRSVSTETPFESTLSCAYGIPYIKIGPLLTDYSSVIRLNEILRLVGKG